MIRQTFAASPSVWKLRDETTIRSMADQSGSDPSSILAQAVLAAGLAAVAAGVYPAWRMASTAPAAGLREE